ncbi:MAG: hypothetical protein WAP52_03430 [Candidatus Sungiibacteriota bacterium]
MHEKITTIEGLATMIQRTMASKEDLAQLSDRMENVESVMKDMREEMNATRKDVSYIRSTMNALSSNDTTQDAVIINLAKRVEILEDHPALVPA